MDLDLNRMPTGTAGWSALIDHAKGLGDLSEVDWLELKGTLAFSERAERKRSAVTLARTILGMANRNPESASKHLAGHGVLLVGVEGNAVTGAERVDGAQLHDALDPYVGQDGLVWDYAFVDHPDGLVLALTVDPPEWGDPIFTFRKEFSDGGTTIRDGEVFVRVPGKTRPATSQDLRDLQRRLTASPSSGADVAVGYVGKFDHVAAGSASDLVHSVVDREADSLIASAPPVQTLGMRMPAYTMVTRGDRSPKRYRSLVDQWREEAHEKAEAVAREFMRHELSRGKLRIVNNSDRYLEGVRVQIQFPPGVLVLVGSDTDYHHHGNGFNFFSLLPERPPTWEKYNPILGSIGSLALARPHVTPMPFTSEFDVEETDGSATLTWDVGDLRPKDTEISDEVVAVITEEHGDTMPVLWRVTARGVDHLFTGHVEIACAQEPIEHLGWSLPESEVDELDA